MTDQHDDDTATREGRRGPLAWLPGDLRGPLFGGATSLAVVLLGIQVVLDRSLAPYGIVGLELAGTAERAGLILVAWGCGGRTAAAFGLGLDMLFALTYATALALACDAVAGPPGTGVRHRVGLWLAWGALAAGALDLVENVALALMLLGGHLAPWAGVATVCAVPKFILVALALLFAAAGALVAPLRR